MTVTFESPKHQANEASGTKSAPSPEQLKILRKCLEEMPIKELMRTAGRLDRTKFRHQVLQPLLDNQWVEMTLPDKPTSSQQRYRLTALGKSVLMK